MLTKIWRTALNALGLYDFLTSELVRTILWPFAVSGLVAVTGLFVDTGLPVSIVITATVMAFAATAGGLLWFRQWVSTQNPAFKLEFLECGMFKDTEKDEAGGEFLLKYLQYGIFLRNTATFPMSVKLEYIDGGVVKSSDGRVLKIESEKRHRNTSHVLAPRQAINVRAERIDMNCVKCGDLSGEFKFRLKYGKEGNERFVIEKEFSLEGTIDPATGNITKAIFGERTIEGVSSS